MIIFALLFSILFGDTYSADPVVVSFVYHRFGDHRYQSTNTTLEDFEAHLRYLKDYDFSVKTLSEAMKNLKSGYSRTVVITIDDGFKSFYQYGFPLLKKYGFTATLFINTESIGKQDFMSWDQIKEVRKYGVEIGNHSNGHEHFLDFKPDEQLVKFKSSLENASESFFQNLKFRPKIFAYPYGEYTLSMESYLKESGFIYAMAQNSGVIDHQTSPLRLPRFSMTGRYASIDRFIEKVAMNTLQVTDFSTTQIVNDTPSLKLQIIDDRINPESLQCFIQGKETCKIKIESENPLIIVIDHSGQLLSRRTLYTITAQSKIGNKWHWYSKLWVQPGIVE